MNDESIKKQINFFCKLPETSYKLWDYPISFEKQSGRKSPVGISKNNNKGPLGLEIPISIIAVQLCVSNDIICAFKRLYKKYIDPNNACFMVNISSMNRETLVTLLDAKYYCNHIRKQHSAKLVSRKSIRQLVRFSGTDGDSNSNGINGISVANDNLNSSLYSEKKNDRSMIDQLFEKHNKSKEWLIRQLLICMDCVALELSQLMRDSFARFKSANS